MVLNKFAFLTRQGLGKSLTHVPQTFVAGTQSSYASSSSPFAFGNHASGKFGKAGNAHLHTSFQSSSAPSAAQNKAASGSGNGDKNDSGLAAYYDAWQKQHQPGAEDKEWKQFQFTKRIGWKPPTAAVLAGRAKEREERGLRPDARLGPVSLNRAYSASAVDDIKKSEILNDEAEALAKVNEAIAVETGQSHGPSQHAEPIWQLPGSNQTYQSKTQAIISEQHTTPLLSESQNVITSTDSQPPLSLGFESGINNSNTKEVSPPPLLPDPDNIFTLEDKQQGSALLPDSAAMAASTRSVRTSSVQSGSSGDLQSSTELLSTGPATTPEHVIDEATYFNDQICKLSSTGEYARIPSAFKDLLAKGLRPSIEAYNALLSAVVRMPAPKHHMVSRALDAYTNMLQHAVIPDTAFYTTLIDLLSSNAMDVSTAKQQLEQQHLRSGFLLPSKAAEYELLAEDTSAADAIKIFDSSRLARQNHVYPSELYQLLILACAKFGKTEEMIRAVTHMELHKVSPIATIFPAMIEAFGVVGDLKNAVDECYPAYRALAVANDNGQLVIQGRHDNEVYAAVVRSFVRWGSVNAKHIAKAMRFYHKVFVSYDTVVRQQLQTEDHQGLRAALDSQSAVLDTILVDGFVQGQIDAGHLAEALRTAEDPALTPLARNKALTHIAIAGADKNNTAACTTAYDKIDDRYHAKMGATRATLHMWLREGELGEARRLWSVLLSGPPLDGMFVQTTAHYAATLISYGYPDEGLIDAKAAFAAIRAGANNHPEILEFVDEAIEYLGASLRRSGMTPSAHASLGFLQAMVENRGLVGPLAEQLFAGISSQDIEHLPLNDLIFLLQTQAEVMIKGTQLSDVAHGARLAHLISTTTATRAQVDHHTYDLVSKAITKIPLQQQSPIQANWRAFCQPVHTSLQPSIPTVSVSEFNEYNRRYHQGLDVLISTRMSNTLDRALNGTNKALDSALEDLRNLRRIGRHPRYDVYAKLIYAAVKFGRTNLVHDIHGMARTDVPLLPGHNLSCQGWAQILDTMIGACLATGKRPLAEEYHLEMLSFGQAPTANTFGLYITTMKGSTKTFDEASEAMKIFNRAHREGVRPTSFLYNTVIGKLAKARRIEDTTRLFSEMRNLNIRATSVTYGSVISALTRVSDVKLAEDLFNEMEVQHDYRPRPAPYNSMMQFFVTTQRDSNKVIEYYARMQENRIPPTMHTYKLLIDTYGQLDTVDFAAAENVLETMRAAGLRPEAVHYASLITSKGCALHDLAGARQIFDEVLAQGSVQPHTSLYQALLEAMVANIQTEGFNPTDVLEHMSANHVGITPYIANQLIKGWAHTMDNIGDAENMYNNLGQSKREPSTYEEMTKAFMRWDMRDQAMEVVNEMMGRGYPNAVTKKVGDLLGLAGPAL